MTWLTPMIGAIAASIAVPSLIILYFLKLKRRELEVSSTLLWKKAVQDLQANAPFQRLRRNLLLFLQLLVLAAALLAVAQPQRKGDSGPGEKGVILIDRSASMATMDEMSNGRPMSRLDKAKIDAERFVDELPSGGLFESSQSGEAMVIAFDTSADVVQTFTTNKGLLKQAIRSIQPSDAPTSIDQAMKLATAYVGPKVIEGVGMTPGSPLYLWSDGAIPDVNKLQLHPDTRLEYRATGKAKTVNTAITALRAERPYDKPGELAVFVGLQSNDPGDHSEDVELSIDGVVSAVKSVRVQGAKPGDVTTGGVVFRMEKPERAVIAARLTKDDALMADNAARIIVPPAKRLNVALVTAGNLFLESALGGLIVNKAEVLTPAQYADVLKTGRTSEYDVFVMDRVNPADPLGEAGKSAAGTSAPMPGGKFLIFGAVPLMRGLSLGPAIENPQPDVAADWVRDHPALELISLNALVVSRPMPVRADENVRVIARGTGGPFIIEAAQDATRALIVCFDSLDSNWPFDVSFVLFLASSVGYLGQADAALAQQIPVGTMLNTDLPEGVRDAVLKTPDNQSVRLIAGQDRAVTFGPLRKTGVYTLRWSGPPGPRDEADGGSAVRTIAVNLFDPPESSVAARDTLDLPAKSVQASGKGADDKTQRRLWPWLLLAAVGLVMLEWLVYNRKTYV